MASPGTLSFASWISRGSASLFFKGFTRFLMFTAIPAGFISYAPVVIVGERKLEFVIAMAGFTSAQASCPE